MELCLSLSCHLLRLSSLSQLVIVVLDIGSVIKSIYCPICLLVVWKFDEFPTYVLVEVITKVLKRTKDKAQHSVLETFGCHLHY